MDWRNVFWRPPYGGLFVWKLLGMLFERRLDRFRDL